MRHARNTSANGKCWQNFSRPTRFTLPASPMASLSPGHSASTARHCRSASSRSPRSAGQRRQVAPGQVAVDALVQAGELLGPRQGQYPPPAVFGLGRLAAMPVHDRLAEPQLGVFGVERKPLGAALERRLEIAQHLVGPGDQGKELAGDRIGGCRVCQAATEVPKRFAPLRVLDGDRAQIKQRKRIIRPFGELFEQDPRVPVKLSRPQAPGRRSRCAVP